MSALCAPPRRLSALDTWTLRLGSPVLWLGLVLATMLSLLGWTLVAAYGVKFSSVRHQLIAQEVVVGRVETSGVDRLASGEPVTRTTALFSWNSATYRAVGYGAPTPPLEVGQQVDVLLSQREPSYAWIHGLDPYPLNLGLLARGLAIGLLPAFALMLLGLVQGYREEKLLREASCVTGQRGRSLPLPRPFSGTYLSRYSTKGELFSTWSVGPDVGERPLLLWASRGRPAVVEHLLPDLKVDGDTVSGLSWTRRWRLLTVLGMLALQALMILGFLMT